MTDDKAENRVCFRCTVAGRVQGVFFRASAREEALAHGVSGYARNLPDGRVEVLACGRVEAVAAMRQWLSHGPTRAEVTGVACEAVDYRELSGFTTS